MFDLVAVLRFGIQYRQASHCWKLTRVPTSAQRTDEMNAGDQPTRSDICQGTLIGELHGLRRQNFQIGRCSTLVAVRA